MSWHRLESCVLESWPIELWHARKVLVAVSGGPDSVATLCALLRIAGGPANLMVGHFNHRWRGVDSDGDAQFVGHLCQRLGVVYVEGTADRDSLVSKSEDTARRMRYDFLTSAAYQAGARCVVTGHTADDRIETVLHNLFRGSGLAGIAGPRVTRTLADGLHLVRPILGAFRSDVLDYLSTHKLGFRTDSSNADDRYARNFIRTRLLPLVREHYVHGVDSQLLTMADIARESIDALSQIARQWLERVSVTSVEALAAASRTGLERPWWLDRSSLRETPEPVLREALKLVWQARQWSLKSMTRNHWKQINAALNIDNGPPGQCQNRLTLPGNLRVAALDDWRFIGPPQV